VKQIKMDDYIKNIQASPLYIIAQPPPSSPSITIKNEPSTNWGIVIFMLFLFIAIICVLVYIFLKIRNKKWFQDIINMHTNTSNETPKQKNNSSKKPNEL
jgi:hypothetical protein